MDVYTEFSGWLNKQLSRELPDNVVAINFNLYEGLKNVYEIELVGCDSFDKENSDWACDEVFTTREDLFLISRTEEIAHWEQGLSFISTLIEKYLRVGEYASKLKSFRAVSIGFVDGDLDILYCSE